MAPERTESASLRSHSCLSQTTHTCTHSVCTLQYIRPAHTRAAFTMVKPRQKAVISCAVDELLCFYRDLFEISGRNTPLRKTPPCRQRGPRETHFFRRHRARVSARGWHSATPPSAPLRNVADTHCGYIKGHTQVMEAFARTKHHRAWHQLRCDGTLYSVQPQELLSCWAGEPHSCAASPKSARKMPMPGRLPVAHRATRKRTTHQE